MKLFVYIVSINYYPSLLQGDNSTVVNVIEEPEDEFLPDIPDIEKESNDKEEPLNFFNRKRKKRESMAKPVRPRRCGLCHKVGHNRRICDFRSFLDEVIFNNLIIYPELPIV